MARRKSKVGVLDFETDPFVHGRIPEPFAVCVYFAPDDYFILYEPNIIDRLIKYLRSLPDCTLYAHNGGKFDFRYLVEYAAPNQEIQIINGRFMSLDIGNVTLKDSYPLMPFPLAEYQKKTIDYGIMEANKRHKPANRKLIIDYLLSDCVFLFALVTGFKQVVGDKDTIGSAAFYQMRKTGIKIAHLNETHDELFRPYYFGGRVEAFKHGVFNGPFIYLDVNSAYPFAMLHNHPHGSDYRLTKKLPPLKELGPQFIKLVATSYGALPMRAADGRLNFPSSSHSQEFYATGWEVAAGLETKTLVIHQVVECWSPCEFINFKTYIEFFFALRQKAKEDGNEIHRLAYKYLLNSGYGKFAQNPREFKTYRLAPYGEDIEGFKWETDYGALSLWSQSSYNGHGFFDVSTGASITGFQRALLWRGIKASRNVLYVDTDSILCKSSTVEQSNDLGQWKIEGVVSQAAIAGKKLYGIQWAMPQNGLEFKVASKGARLSYKDIISVCKGDAITWSNDAPSFNASRGEARFTTRTIRATR